MTTIAKNTICIWYDGDAEEAARFYAATLTPASTRCTAPPADYPSGKAGDVLTVMFTVMGIPCMGLNGGPAVQHNIACFRSPPRTRWRPRPLLERHHRQRRAGERLRLVPGQGACPGRSRRWR